MGTVHGARGDGDGCLVLVRRAVDRGVVATVVTGARGACSVEDLPPGIDLQGVAFERAADEVLLVVAVNLEPGETRELRLGATTSTGVEGRVTVDARPAAGASVFLDAGDQRLRCPTGVDGQFRIEVARLKLKRLYPKIKV